MKCALAIFSFLCELFNLLLIFKTLIVMTVFLVCSNRSSKFLFYRLWFKNLAIEHSGENRSIIETRPLLFCFTNDAIGSI